MLVKMLFSPTVNCVTVRQYNNLKGKTVFLSACNSASGF